MLGKPYIKVITRTDLVVACAFYDYRPDQLCTYAVTYDLVIGCTIIKYN